MLTVCDREGDWVREDERVSLDETVWLRDCEREAVAVRVKDGEFVETCDAESDALWERLPVMLAVIDWVRDDVFVGVID